jgi:glycosyltransferase involved in cell wall biosynthesis
MLDVRIVFVRRLAGPRVNILHLIPTLDPRAGGPPLIATHLAAAQAVLGHNVHIMAYRSPDAGQARIITENRQHGFDRVTQHLLPFITLSEQITGTNAHAMAKDLVPNMDAIHIHGIWESLLYRTAAVARRHSKPYLILLNGMLFPWAMQRGKLKKRITLLAGAQKMLNHGILQFGSKDEQLAAEKLGYTKPGVIIPNGTSPEEFADLPPAGTLRALHPRLRDDPFVLFLGRLHEQKGIDLLLSAFQIVMQKHPTARLVIAGPDYGRSTEIQSRTLAAGIQDRLLMIGPVFGQQKLAALRDATCFCLPSRHEGFSLAVLESLACGTPVVISPECHFPEVAECGAGLIPSLDPQAIAEALGRMLADVSFRSHASTAAKNLASRLTWTDAAAKAIAAYDGHATEKSSV